MSYYTKQTVSLGLVNPKSPLNMGSILRAAGCFDVSSVFYTGQRINYAMAQRTDTHNHASDTAMIGCDELADFRPQGAQMIAVELAEGATPLPEFEHPDNAYYLFGPEDGSIKQSLLSQCDHAVYVPSRGCLNLAASVNVLLYDRLAKRSLKTLANNRYQIIRDTNNNLQFRNLQPLPGAFI